MHILVDGLTVTRGATIAVEGVSFEVEAGSWIGIIGANGSGKTSLLRALAGRLEAAAGTILVDGIDRTSDRAWRAHSFGFAPDPAALPNSLTGAELFAILSGDEPATDEERLDGLRRALAFDHFLDQRIGGLSAGMRQRLAIFSAFANQPRLVILDEPFNWLDPVCAFDTRLALRGLVAEQGLTLVTALHDPTTLLHQCDCGLLLSEGRVARRLSRAELASGAKDHAGFEARLIAALRGSPP